MVTSTMSSLVVALFALVAFSFRACAALQVEILALRHQLAVLRNNAPRRLRLKPSDRYGHPLAPESFRLVLDQEVAASREERRWRRRFAI
jgi:hypothetical protein